MRTDRRFLQQARQALRVRMVHQALMELQALTVQTVRMVLREQMARTASPLN
jgi:hypothetical protein